MERKLVIRVLLVFILLSFCIIFISSQKINVVPLYEIKDELKDNGYSVVTNEESDYTVTKTNFAEKYVIDIHFLGDIEYTYITYAFGNNSYNYILHSDGTLELESIRTLQNEDLCYSQEECYNLYTSDVDHATEVVKDEIKKLF